MTKPKKTVFLLCGVPGSGKSWICEQLEKQGWNYVRHDYKTHNQILAELQLSDSNRIIVDCPFKERELREKMEASGFAIKPHFIVESPEVVAERYRARENRSPDTNVITRATTIKNRAEEWQAPQGTSSQMLTTLLESPQD